MISEVFESELQVDTPQSRALAKVTTVKQVLGDSSAYSFLSLLTEQERSRYWSFRSEEARQSFLAGHILLRRAAAEFLCADIQEIEVVQRCTVCGGPHGKPRALGHPDLVLSLAHSGALVSASASNMAGAVDLEHLKNIDVSTLLASRVFSATERLCVSKSQEQSDEVAREVAARIWIRKECLVKVDCLDLDSFASCDVLWVPSKDTLLPSTGSLMDFRIFEWIDPQLEVMGAVLFVGSLSIELFGDLLTVEE